MAKTHNTIELKNITRTYGDGDSIIKALDHINLTVADGEFIAIMGPSGSGKSTLLNILGLLDQPSSGTYLLDGEDVSGKKGKELARIRGKKIGFIFQVFNLLPKYNVLKNVVLPMIYQGVKSSARKTKATELIKKMGLIKRINHKPNMLSGGERQRVSIARALTNDPSVLLADEPTGNLDSKNTTDIMNILTELNNKGVTILCVTHEDEVAAYAKRVVRMRDGKIVEDKKRRG